MPTNEITIIRSSDRDPNNVGGDSGTVLIARDVTTDISGTLGINIATFENCRYDYTPKYDVYLYCLSGTLRVGTSAGDVVANPGDGIWIPKGTPITYKADDTATLVDAYFPVNWKTLAESGELSSPSGDVCKFAMTDRLFDDFLGNGSCLLGRDVGPDVSTTMGTNTAVFEHCSFEWTIRYDEYLYCLEGELTFETNGGTHVLNPGDAIWFPEDTWMVIKSDKKSVAVVAVYPVDWRDRTGFDKSEVAVGD